jgi:hypothetical protein
VIFDGRWWFELLWLIALISMSLWALSVHNGIWWWWIPTSASIVWFFVQSYRLWYRPAA